MGLGLNLKKILKDRNMTIKELSEKSGVSLNTLYSITKRDNNMSRYDIIEKIASTLDITVKELTGYDIDKSKTNIKNARLYEVIDNNKELSIDHTASFDTGDWIVTYSNMLTGLTSDELKDVQYYIEFIKSKRSKDE